MSIESSSTFAIGVSFSSRISHESRTIELQPLRRHAPTLRPSWLATTS
ncbi:MAG: hypothetical protein ACYTGZ_21430 [Planctomycetota bacterium]|jgi:hypothetical protein